VRLDASGSAPAPCRSCPGHDRAYEGRSGRGARLDRGVRKRAPVSGEHALGTARPHEVDKSHGARVPGHRATRRADAPDCWGEAVWKAPGCAVSRRPAHRQTRTPTEDAAHRHQRGPQRPREQAPFARHHTEPVPTNVVWLDLGQPTACTDMVPRKTCKEVKFP
jgi:hypothetical protein